MTWMWIFLGGGIGAILRYAISQMTYNPNSGFPLGTFVANLLACLLLSIIIFSLKDIDPKMRLFIGVGLCGGLSTFSTFSFETVDLIQNGQIGMSILYVLLSIITCGMIFYSAWWLSNS